MPRLRDTTHPMTRTLKGYGITGASLSTMLHCAPKTARDKLNDPTRLTLGDLRIIHNKVGIPLDEIRSNVP